METKNRINFSLLSINEEKFEIEDNLVIPDNPLAVQYLIESEIRPESDSIYVRTGIRYLIDKDVICECILGMHFAIENFKSVISIDEESKRINFSSNLMPTFWGITYGALRGVLFEKVKNTPMERFPLPLISMEQLEKMNHFRVVK